MGYQTIVRIERLKVECDKLGLRMCQTKYAMRIDSENLVAVVPKDSDSLPVYSRDTELFLGSLDELEVWLRGVNWARDYDRKLMGKTIDVKRERKEQDYRNEELVRILKNTESKTK